MPRFVDKSGTKFWEITREGTTITRRSGSVGNRGRTTSHDHANALLARWHYRNAIGRKTHSEGYRPEPALPDPISPHEFDGSDDALVYADILQQRGDPRGELIALHHAGLDAEAEVLLTRHAHTWLGDLADARDLVELDFPRLERFRCDLPLAVPALRHVAAATWPRPHVEVVVG